MTDGQWLFTVFAALYLLECARWLPGTAVVLHGVGKYWHTRRPWRQVEIGGARLLMLPVLPPMQASLIPMPWVLAPCDEGVEWCDPDGADSVLVPWSELAPKVDGARLILSAQVQRRLPDEAAAKAWKERLNAWAGMMPAAREKDFLKLARQSLDVAALTAQTTALSQRTRWLRWLAALIFIWAFWVITVLYRWLGDRTEVHLAAGVLLLLLWVQAILFWCVAKREKVAVKHRFWKALAIAFLPQHGMRAADLICMAQVCTAHPLAARDLLEDSVWRKMAASVWKQLQHGRLHSAAVQIKALEAFFRQHEIKPEDLEELSVRHPGSEAYCPNCQAQFTDAALLCQDCGGLPLKTWPEMK